MSQKLVQSQQLTQTQTLTPQQLMVVRLLELPVTELEERIQNIPRAPRGGEVIKVIAQRDVHAVRFQKGGQPFARRKAQGIAQEASVSPETGEKGFEFQNIGKVAAPSSAGKQLEPGQITPLENDRKIPVFVKRKRR